MKGVGKNTRTLRNLGTVTAWIDILMSQSHQLHDCFVFDYVTGERRFLKDAGLYGCELVYGFPYLQGRVYHRDK